MKKYNLLFISLLIILSFSSFTFATNEDETNYLYTNDSGELIESDDYEFDDSAILIDNEDDYNNLVNGEDKDSQAELKTAFDEQSKELFNYEKEENDEKLVITKVLSDIKSEYTTDYYYYYIIKYQIVNVRSEDGKETPAIVILSYDVSDNKNLKPLKAGDTVYGYVEYVTSEDETYNMVNHGLKDSEIAYVSVTQQDRVLGIVLLSIFTMLLLILYAGKHGAKLLIPIFVAIDLLFICLIPELELGKNIILISSLIALELIVLITVLRNGFSMKSAVASISTLIVVVLVSMLALLFFNANGITGKGIVTEENYDLLSNVYYIDQVFKTKVDTQGIALSAIIIITSVIAATISSKLTDISEKYAGSKNMATSIIEEAKPIIAEYPMIISIIFLVLSVPNVMISVYNHSTLTNIINSEASVTSLSILLISIISTLIVAPITAIISSILMGNVEVKQIEEKK